MVALLFNVGVGMWLALSGAGEMTGEEMLCELQRDQVCPVMTFLLDSHPTVPVFITAELAYLFARRNSPRGSGIAVMELDESDRLALSASGFQLQEMDWAKKKKTDVHVLYLNREVRTYSCRPW